MGMTGIGRIVIVACVRAVTKRAVGSIAFQKGRLHAEVRVKHIAPLAVQKIHRASIVAGLEVGLKLRGTLDFASKGEVRWVYLEGSNEGCNGIR